MKAHIIILGIPFVLIGCDFSGKYVAAEPCEGANVVNGDWTLDNPIGPVFDGTSYGSTISGCQSMAYSFGISFGGNIAPMVTDYVVWGGVLNGGTIDIRDSVSGSSWVTSSSTRIAQYENGDGIGSVGWSRMTCDPISATRYDCQTSNDFLTGQDRDFDFEVSATNPDKAVLGGNIVLDSIFGGWVSTTPMQQCSYVEMNAGAKLMTRVSDVPSAPLALADDTIATCDVEAGDTGDTGGIAAMPERPSYHGHTAVEFVRLARASWVATANTPTARHASVDAFLLANVYPADRAAVAPYAHSVVTTYFMPTPSGTLMKGLINTSVSYIGLHPPSPTSDAILENVASNWVARYQHRQ